MNSSPSQRQLRTTLWSLAAQPHAAQGIAYGIAIIRRPKGLRHAYYSRMSRNALLLIVFQRIGRSGITAQKPKLHNKGRGGSSPDNNNRMVLLSLSERRCRAAQNNRTTPPYDLCSLDFWTDLGPRQKFTFYKGFVNS